MDVIARIFENRVGLLKKQLDENQKKMVSDKIMERSSPLTKNLLLSGKNCLLYMKLKRTPLILKNILMH